MMPHSLHSPITQKIVTASLLLLSTKESEAFQLSAPPSILGLIESSSDQRPTLSTSRYPAFMSTPSNHQLLTPEAFHNTQLFNALTPLQHQPETAITKFGSTYHHHNLSNSPSAAPAIKDTCSIESTLEPIDQINNKNRLDQHAILHITKETINDILSDHTSTITGRVKSKESEIGKQLKLVLTKHVGQKSLDNIFSRANHKAILARMINRHWLNITNSIDELDHLHDSVGIRVITKGDNSETCYQALQKIINAPEMSCFYQIKPDSFKDYIKHRKENDYQSLHVVVTSEANPDIQVEIQVRTEEMHKIAESGDACHETYKNRANLLFTLYSQECSQRYNHTVFPYNQ